MAKLDVEVKAELAWCNKHYRLIPPIVDPRTATYALVGTLLNTKEFQVLCGLDKESGTKADPGRAQEQIEEISPVCCFIGDEAVSETMLRVKNKAKSTQNGHAPRQDD
jgi:hypothetical protein